MNMVLIIRKKEFISGDRNNIDTEHREIIKIDFELLV